MPLGLQRFLMFIAGLVVIAVVVGQAWARLATTPATLGPQDGQLRPCPTGSERCVVSTSTDPATSVPPLECPGLVGDELLARAREVLAGLPRTSIVDEAGGWVHAVSSSAFFGFKDDVELLLRANLRHVDVRSESRLPQGDGAVNRQRVLDLVKAVDQSCHG